MLPALFVDYLCAHARCCRELAGFKGKEKGETGRE